MSRSSRIFNICEDRLESYPPDFFDSCETRLGRAGLEGDDGPAPGDCDGYEFCLAGDPILPEDRELLNDEFAGSSSADGNGDFFFANESAAVAGGDGV